MEIKEYHKIENVFKRDLEGTKKLIEGEFSNKLVEYLANNQWIFTEKIDGMNIRIHWDGHEVTYKGRTDRAQIPATLFQELVRMFGTAEAEEVFEQIFGDKEVTLYGEGYGDKIQKVGSLYSKGNEFSLFDVMVGDIWLDRNAVEDIAKAFGVGVVPIIMQGTIQQGVDFVKTQPRSTIGSGEAPMEGVVGKPMIEIQDKTGRRVVVKIKAHEFQGR